MFDIGNARDVYTSSVHLHFVILCLLISLTVISAIVTGYATAGKSARDSLLMIIYALIISFTIYIIIDLEFPRVGMIRESDFDSQLINLKEHMQKDPVISGAQ